jgi:hypothetical protein
LHLKVLILLRISHQSDCQFVYKKISIFARICINALSNNKGLAYFLRSSFLKVLFLLSTSEDVLPNTLLSFNIFDGFFSPFNAMILPFSSPKSTRICQVRKTEVSRTCNVVFFICKFRNFIDPGGEGVRALGIFFMISPKNKRRHLLVLPIQQSLLTPFIEAKLLRQLS